ncbi:leucine-rich repeat- and IQ domain-containing protein 1 [Ciona intestinalis]
MWAAKQKYQKSCLNRENAAVLIQSTWRGFLVRKSIKKALHSFQSEDTIENYDDFEEIDISELQFDEEKYDDKWAYKRSPVMPDISPKFETRETLKSPQSEHGFGRNSSLLTRTPLPPIPTANSEGASRYENSEYDVINQISSRSGNSIASSKMKLASEWGIHNSETTELLLRRRRRLKGKRVNIQGAEDKLRRFQTIKNKIPVQTFPQKKPAAKIHYFKGES